MKRLFQFAFLSAAAVALVSGMASCSKGGDDTQLSEYLKIVPDKTVIMSDGFDAATLSVEYDGVDVTGKAVIFNSDGTEAALQDSRFTTETSGTYSFYATYNGERSHEVTITAIDSALPEIPDDPQPESTDFVRRVLLLQFTGTACGNCPYVMAALDRLSTSPVREDYVRVACHSYNGDDPAYYSGPLARSQDVPGYPHLTLDLDKNLFVQSNANSDVVYATCAGFIQDELEDRPASAGIAACAAVSGENVIVSMSVKAAKAGQYKVGAWLVENGIYAQQAGTSNESYYTHNDCLRYAQYTGSGTKADYSGESLGKLDAGEEAEYSFSIPVDEGWKIENCHLVLIVSAAEGSSYYVNNVASLEIGGTVSYEYEE